MPTDAPQFAPVSPAYSTRPIRRRDPTWRDESCWPLPHSLSRDPTAEPICRRCGVDVEAEAERTDDDLADLIEREPEVHP